MRTEFWVHILLQLYKGNKGIQFALLRLLEYSDDVSGFAGHGFKKLAGLGRLAGKDRGFPKVRVPFKESL